MATGKRAFQGKSHLSMASSILDKDPDPILTILPLAQHALERTVQTCPATDPEERFQSAHDLKLQLLWLTGARAEGPLAGAPIDARSRMKVWAAWAVAGLAVVASVLFWIMRDAGSRPAVARFSIATPANTWLDTDEGPPLAISPYGQRVAYVVRSGDSALPMLYLRRMDAFEGTSVPGTDGASLPFFSPDGHWVGFLPADRVENVLREGGSWAQVMSSTDGAAGA